MEGEKLSLTLQSLAGGPAAQQLTLASHSGISLYESEDGDE
jgi:hypothetical protein